MKPIISASLLALGMMAAPAAFAGLDAFHPGSVIADYGKIADTPDAFTIPADTHFKVDFDVNEPGGAGKLNRHLESAARFINIQAAAGVDPKNIKIAVVIHGKASWDLTNAATYAAKYETDKANPNAGLVTELQKHGVRFIVCGQTARYYNIDKADMLPGVEESPSAMTAHALLQQQGYTLNPF